MKIRLDGHESWQVSISYYGDEFEVPDETIQRWESAREAWDSVQDEMGELITQKRIQHEADRIEVARLRREALKAAQCSAT